MREKERRVCTFLYVLSVFVCFFYECVFVYAWWRCVCVCFFVHYSRQHLLSMLHNGGASGEFYHQAWLFWGGTQGPGGLAQRAPMMLKRWLNWKEGWEILLVFIMCVYGRDETGGVCVCVCKSQEGRTQESKKKSPSQHATGLPLVPP